MKINFGQSYHAIFFFKVASNRAGQKILMITSIINFKRLSCPWKFHSMKEIHHKFLKEKTFSFSSINFFLSNFSQIYFFHIELYHAPFERNTAKNMTLIFFFEKLKLNLSWQKLLKGFWEFIWKIKRFFMPEEKLNWILRSLSSYRD